MLWAGIRQLLLGIIAVGVTFVVGRAIGASPM
jgi:VIT1/CCC1 family predicted Fe2+/Mn2+ transporter